MATRCLIGKQSGDSIEAIYCHFDGYLNGVGYTLKDHYSNESIVSKLIALGDISMLGDKLEPNEGEEHSFDHPAKDVTIAYHRDRGEDLSKLTFANEEEYLDYVKSEYYEYAYLFKGGEWYYYASNRKMDAFDIL